MKFSFRGMSDEISRVLFPERCISCGILSKSLCSTCSREWRYSHHLRVLDDLNIYSSITYGAVAQRVLLSSKENSEKSADLLLVQAIKYSLQNLLLSEVAASSRGYVLVPMPSRRANSRRRGRNFLVEIAEEVADHMNMTSLSLFAHAREIKDQSALKSDARRNNIAHSFVVTKSTQSPLILVDDLITTGSTLAEGVRAARAAGFLVIGAVTAATSEPVRLAHLASQ